MKRKQIAVIIGTRPEAIKMAPVIRQLAASRVLAPRVVSTSQHRQLVGQVLRQFGVRIDHDLRTMRAGQTLWDLSGRLVTRLGGFLERARVAAVLVQGDTSSAFFGALAGFYHRIPVGHVEAGLRTGDRYAPFPEEMNRTLIGSLAVWHFAPTATAVKSLQREGVRRGAIHLTGNTVVDALRWMAPRCDDREVTALMGAEWKNRRLVLVTCHRRESFGEPMKRVARALVKLAREEADIRILFPIHPNPEVRKAMVPLLGRSPNIVLCDPLDYGRFLACLRASYLVLSDSGGIQEEATALGKPVLVLRDRTERPEGVTARALKLVGTETDRIVREGRRLLRSRAAYERMSRASSVFGKGDAAVRIVRILERDLTGKRAGGR
jgi:UDP-N-acetylglucosamine 2-epimerase (non-hydrolysing)